MRKDIAKAIGEVFERAEAARVSSGVDEAAAWLERSEDAERDALAALCAFKCATVADVNARAEYLAGLDGVSPKAAAAALAAPIA